MVRVEMTDERGMNLIWLEPCRSQAVHRAITAIDNPWLSVYKEKIGGLRSVGGRRRPALCTESYPTELRTGGGLWSLTRALPCRCASRDECRKSRDCKPHDSRSDHGRNFPFLPKAVSHQHEAAVPDCSKTFRAGFMILVNPSRDDVMLVKIVVGSSDSISHQELRIVRPATPLAFPLLQFALGMPTR